MRVIIPALAALVLLGRPASSETLSWQGLGLVRLGMTFEEAQRGTPLTPKEAWSSDECWVTQRADRKDKSVYYEVRNGKITAISVGSELTNGATTNITDTRGLGVGATEADIRRAYGDVSGAFGDVKIRYAPGYSKESEISAAAERARLGIKRSEPEPSPEYWLEVDSPNHERTIIFNTQDSKVLWFRTGLKPWVTELECN
jgi:hypothetical protein